MGRHARQKAQQHPAAFVIHSAVQAGRSFRWQPGRVAHQQVRPACWKQIGMNDFNLRLQAQLLDIGTGTVERPHRLVGGNHFLHAAPRQQRRQHTGAGADVKGTSGRLCKRRPSAGCASCPCGCFGYQTQVFAPHRRENAIVRVNPVGLWCAAQSRNFEPFFAPFVAAGDTQQFPQWHGAHSGVRNFDRTAFLHSCCAVPGFTASRMNIGRAAQRQGIAAIRCWALNQHQQQTQQPRSQSALLPVAVKVQRSGTRTFGWLDRSFRWFFACLGWGVNSARHSVQQQPRVMKVAQPNNGSAFFHQPQSRICAHRVVCGNGLCRRCQAAFAVPVCAVAAAAVLPMHH